MIKLLSGNEAVARGAWEAGVKVTSAYPGTPSTEIQENFAHYPNVYAEWAPNEKVAMDVALGASYAGSRAFTSMKHVGLNVALDGFMAGAMTGVEAGLMVVSADDPSMHSSQNEQDNRNIAKLARIPCLEPSDSQSAKDLTIAAFDISERFDTPVMLHMTTRVCHSASAVELGERVEHDQTPEQKQQFVRNLAKYCMVPANANKAHPRIEARIADLAEFAETFEFNIIEPGDSDLGIVTSGIAYQYAKEVFPNASVLHLGMSHPLPAKKIADFAAGVKRLIVLEELDPIIENGIRLMGIEVEGKSIFPIIGEFNPTIVRNCAIDAGLLPEETRVPVLNIDVGPLPGRPPVLCPGCPHRAPFFSLSKLKVPVNGDIGCYTLGMVPPLNALHTVGAMGMGVSIAHGATKGGSPEQHVAVIGDSTLFHSGIPALINVIYNQSPVLTIIMDNRITGMTGHQDNPLTGRTLQGQPAPEIDLEALVRALGFKHVKTVEAYDVPEVDKSIKVFLALKEPAVLITREPCALLPQSRKRWHKMTVDTSICNGCTMCFRIGCPAISKSDELDEKYQRPKAYINPDMCVGCEVCAQVCPRKAIHKLEETVA